MRNALEQSLACDKCLSKSWRYTPRHYENAYELAALGQGLEGLSDRKQGDYVNFRRQRTSQEI